MSLSYLICRTGTSTWRRTSAITSSANSSRPSSPHPTLTPSTIRESRTSSPMPGRSRRRCSSLLTIEWDLESNVLKFNNFWTRLAPFLKIEETRIRKNIISKNLGGILPSAGWEDLQDPEGVAGKEELATGQTWWKRGAWNGTARH